MVNNITIRVVVRSRSPGIIVNEEPVARQLDATTTWTELDLILNQIAEQQIQNVSSTVRSGSIATDAYVWSNGAPRLCPKPEALDLSQYPSNNGAVIFQVEVTGELVVHQRDDSVRNKGRQATKDEVVVEARSTSDDQRVVVLNVQVNDVQNDRRVAFLLPSTPDHMILKKISNVTDDLLDTNDVTWDLSIGTQIVKHDFRLGRQLFEYPGALETQMYADIVVRPTKTPPNNDSKLTDQRQRLRTQRTVRVEVRFMSVCRKPISALITLTVLDNTSSETLSSQIKKHVDTVYESTAKGLVEYLRCLLNWYTEIGTAAGRFELMSEGRSVGSYGGSNSETIIARVTMGLEKPTVDNLNTCPHELLTGIPSVTKFNQWMRELERVAERRGAKRPRRGKNSYAEIFNGKDFSRYNQPVLGDEEDKFSSRELNELDNEMMALERDAALRYSREYVRLVERVTSQ